MPLAMLLHAMQSTEAEAGVLTPVSYPSIVALNERWLASSAFFQCTELECHATAFN